MNKENKNSFIFFIWFLLFIQVATVPPVFIIQITRKTENYAPNKRKQSTLFVNYNFNNKF